VLALSELGLMPDALAKYEKMLKDPLWDDTDIAVQRGAARQQQPLCPCFHLEYA